jgi:hypothetical protein
MEEYAHQSPGTVLDKFENFPKYVSRQNIACHQALFEIFKLALPVQGDII